MKVSRYWESNDGKLRFWQRSEWDFHHSLLVSKSVHVTNKRRTVRLAACRSPEIRFHSLQYCVASLCLLGWWSEKNSFAPGILQFLDRIFHMDCERICLKILSLRCSSKFFGETLCKRPCMTLISSATLKGGGLESEFLLLLHRVLVVWDAQLEASGHWLNEVWLVESSVIQIRRWHNKLLPRTSDSWSSSLIVHLNLPDLLGWMMQLFYHDPWHKMVWVYRVQRCWGDVSFLASMFICLNKFGWRNILCRIRT